MAHRRLPIIQRATEFADRIAFESDTHASSYGDLIDSSDSLAAQLLKGNSDLQEARIGFLVPPGKEYVQTQWAIWQAGGVAVPLSLSATEKELSYTLADSQTANVVTTKDLLAKVESPCEEHQVETLLLDDLPPTENVQLPTVTPERRAMILYTSGTTSKPKGVVTTHGCIQAQIESLIEAWNWQTDDRIPLFLPLHHVHGIINVMSCALWSGATIEAFPRFDLNTVFDRVSNHAYTVFMAVPTIYVKMIAALDEMATTERDAIVQGFDNMRLMISGSAALPASVHEQWTKLTGQKLLERYGMTEIGMALSNPYDGERRAGAVGQPLPSVEIRLQSESEETITADGISGEIQVRGPTVFQEYWNRPQATTDSFVDGWFRTGDIAVVDDQYYRIMGRSSIDIIKSGGYKLSALEIEASLLDHPAICECAIVGVPDETWGETVAAAVVLGQDAKLDLKKLRDWCQGRISPYKIPRKLLVVDSLPRNAMGKVTKPAVTKLFED